MNGFEGHAHNNSTKEYKSLGSDKEVGILKDFSKSECVEIEKRRNILSSLAHFISKDFEIPVELNEAGAGWYWNFDENKIRIDPNDLLLDRFNKSRQKSGLREFTKKEHFDYLRYTISHEGGHRRISRVESIPYKEWNRPGFSFMINAIEDPRDNNFVAENYPNFLKQMVLRYGHGLEIEETSRKKAQKKLGYKPLFMRAGFEYIKLWYKERNGENIEISEDLPDKVKNVVQKTLNAAQNSWSRYPSKQEADDVKNGEKNIKAYANESYVINRDDIWPEFSKLVEKDIENQKNQEFIKGVQKKGGADGGTKGLPQEIKERLTPEEQKELENAIEKAIDEMNKGLEEKTSESNNNEVDGAAPIDLDSLSKELSQKIKDYVDSLPEEEQKELEKKAKEAICEFGEELANDVNGEFSNNTQKDKEKSLQEKGTTEGYEVDKTEQAVLRFKDLKKYKELISERLKKDENVYEEYRRDVLPIINKLENYLREVFVRRHTNAWKTGFKNGKRINIKRRIQEKAKGISVIESRAWQKKDQLKEKDYAISLLVDLSGSMHGEKIEETFKAVIVLSEVLNRLSISTEILGFNNYIHEYQKYGEQISKSVREKIGGMLEEVSTASAQWNDDGWALQKTSARLAKQKCSEKFIIVLTDGVPEESPEHSGSRYNLNEVIKQIQENTDQKLIGLGIGQGTEHVKDYYPTGFANVDIEEMAEKISDLIRDVIENYDKF